MVKQDLAAWTKRYIDASGVARIEAAVQKAELQTSGEIVPVLVRASTATGLVPLVMGLIGLLATLALHQSLEGGSWHLEIAWAIVIIGGSALAYFLGRLPSVQRFVLPRYEQRAAVHKRAMLEFYLSQSNKTAGGTGILLFVSLLERKAVVLADHGIARHCKAEVFSDVVADLVGGAKRRDLASGFELAIDRCAGLLKPYFPRQNDDANEISDHLIVRDE